MMASPHGFLPDYRQNHKGTLVLSHFLKWSSGRLRKNKRKQETVGCASLWPISSRLFNLLSSIILTLLVTLHLQPPSPVVSFSLSFIYHTHSLFWSFFDNNLPLSANSSCSILPASQYKYLSNSISTI